MMQQDPYASFSRPVGQADPYAGIGAPVPAAPARQAAPRQPAPARPAAPGMAPAPAAPSAPPLLTVEEMAAANMASGYDPAKAWELAQEDFANQTEGPDPGAAPAQPALPGATASTGFDVPEGVVDWTTLSDEQRQGLRRGARVLMPQNEGETFRQIVTLAADLGGPVREPMMGEDRLSYPGVQAYVPGAADVVGAVTSGAAEQVPLLDEAVTGFDALVNRRSFSESRDQYRSMVEALNEQQRGARNVGGILGATGMMFAPGVGQAGGFIRAGGTGLGQTARAATVGGGAGALFGFANSDGSLADRLEGGLLGAGVGAATGGLLDAGGQAAFRGAARRAARPSAQRLLSREGVQLTPGQMLEPTPIIGPMLRGIEDGLTGIPVAGAVVQGARNQGIETFNEAALNRALAPIGQRLPRGIKPGYEAVEEVQNRLGRAYEDLLPDISAQLDRPLYDDIAAVLSDAAAEMPVDRLDQLRRVLENRVFRNVDQADATISGAQFKRIESELGALARQYRTANDPSAVSFGEAVTGIQGALREMIARQNPQQAARLRQINEGYANLVRIERAAGSTASQATEGVFSPTQLGMAVAQGSGRTARANEGALMQDLAVAGRSVLPSKVGDSGTATRGAITGLLAGGAAFVNPVVAIPAIAATIGAYSKPAQIALNAIYRSTDRRSAESALGELQRYASQNPALASYYEAAARHLQAAFEGPSQGQEPRASGLLSPTAP